MSGFGIVAIGYNRPISMQRLLESLESCTYTENAHLFVSIDFSGDDSVRNIADKMPWTHGEKTIIAYEERQGLRQHVLKCGDLIEKYGLDALAVFEDDVVPSKAFFSYMTQAVDFYKHNMNIAGIALYSFQWIQAVSKPFIPSYNGYDAYFIQCPQSWGQVWMPQQWQAFKQWYMEHESSVEEFDIPQYVKRWPKSSWLKYHYAYCVANDKYFVYPYYGLSTCLAEPGTHMQNKMTVLQIPMCENPEKKYSFPNLEDTDVKYDVYFERMGIGKYIGTDDENLCVDLYGTKDNNRNKKYWLTNRVCSYKIVNSFGAEYKPHEKNVIINQQGNDFYLYDTSLVASNGENREFDGRYYYLNLIEDEILLIKYLLKRKFTRIVNRVRKNK